MATIGATFDFEVFSRRWGRNDTYRITLTQTGWDVQYLGIGGACNSRGEPFLFNNLNQDLIHFPQALGDAFDWLHRSHSPMSDPDLEHAIQQLADWVSETERLTPTGGAFQGLW